MMRHCWRKGLKNRNKYFKQFLVLSIVLSSENHCNCHVITSLRVQGEEFDSSSSWSGYDDELAWAAAWLAKATGESGYLDTARELFDEGGLCTWVPTGFDWDSKTVGVYVLMYELTNEDRSEHFFSWDYQ